MSPDLLVITVPFDGPYPSVNTLGKDGRRYGRKTDAYKALFEAVKEAAEAEMRRTGWLTIEDECEFELTRFVTDHRRRDAANHGKCEMDSLTAAGVWLDDSQATRVQLWVALDPVGPPRIGIIVRKKYWPPTERSLPRPKPRKTPADGMRSDHHSLPSSASRAPTSQSDQVVVNAVTGSTVLPRVAATPPRPSEPQALLNGKPISRSEALEMIQGKR